MLKTILISSIFLLIGILTYKFITPTKNNLLIKNGLWIEVTNNKNYALSENPLLIEKVPNKDLVFISEIKSQTSAKFYQLIINSNDFYSIDLKPEYNCIIKSFSENIKLKINIQCENEAEKTIFFTHTNFSLFEHKNPTNKASFNEDSLQLVGEIEKLNKSIHLTKISIKELENKIRMFSEPHTNNTNSITNTNSGTISLQNKKNEQLKAIEELNKERIDIRRISTYASEINLASRLANTEWKIIEKEWNSNNITKEILPINNETINENSEQVIENNEKGSMWWKEF